MSRAALRAAAVAALLCVVASPLSAESAPKEPVGYRLDDYRSATPQTLKGAKVIDARAAHEVWAAKASVFVDVLPQPPKPKDLPPTAVWRERPRDDIPGSVWLPDTGYGELAAPMQHYFEENLARVTAGEKSKSLVFYCRANCWMSWNAAKRALALGYANVTWFPQGTDGWEKAGFPLEARAPEPRPQ